jgi:hypothetical protein
LTIVIDTSLVVASYDAGAPEHAATTAWLRTCDEELFTTPLAVAEMDCLMSRRGGATARQALWRNLDAEALTVRWWADALSETLSIARRRPEVGLVDASLVALAHRLRTDRIATFDHAHFRTLKTKSGKPFTILPADA